MITVEHLSKCYGDFLAVDDLSFTAEGNGVYGFLGPNGAGKSTTMNIIAGCLSASGGTVRINGKNIYDEPEAAKRELGYLPEQPPLYLNETPLEYLRFIGEAKGLKGEELERQLREVIEKTHIDDVKNRLISALSKGYRQRVGIAQALLGNPGVIILDEPTVGLDPLQIIEIRDLIKQLGEEHTVIFSSHILSEVQAICGKVLIINKGRLIAFDKPENLETLHKASDVITFRVEADKDEVAGVMTEIENVGEWSAEADADGLMTVSAELCGGADAKSVSAAIILRFAAEGKAALEMSTKKLGLEDIFIELTENSGEPEAPEESVINAEAESEETGNEGDI